MGRFSLTVAGFWLRFELVAIRTARRDRAHSQKPAPKISWWHLNRFPQTSLRSAVSLVQRPSAGPMAMNETRRFCHSPWLRNRRGSIHRR